MTQQRMIQAIRDALIEELERDDAVCVIGDGLPKGGSFGEFRDLLQRFGPRRLTPVMPLSEMAFVGMAVGAAMTGLRPIVYLAFMDFLTLAMDPLVHHAGMAHHIFGGQLRAPVTVMTSYGTGRQTGPQHSKSLESWIAHAAGVKVVMPGTPADAKGLLKSAVRDDDPVVFAYPRMSLGDSGEVPDGEHLVPIGRADIKRAGGDVTLVTWGSMVAPSLAAADIAAGHQIAVEVIDLRSIVPWDLPAVLGSVEKTGRLVIAHEASRAFGPGAEIAATVAEQAMHALDAPIARVGGRNVPIPFSPVLERAWMPQVEQIVNAVTSVVARGPRGRGDGH